MTGIVCAATGVALVFTPACAQKQPTGTTSAPKASAAEHDIDRYNGAEPKAHAANPTTGPEEPLSSIPATTRAEAAIKSKSSSGRQDPFAPPEGVFRPFPSAAEKGEAKGSHEENSGSAAGSKIPPPPPGTFAMPPDGTPEHFLPAPPPQSFSSLPVSELPTPPQKPSTVKNIRIIGMIGGKAVVSIDPGARFENKLPRVMTVGAGDQIANISVVEVTKEGVVLEEDGERINKELEVIR